MKLENFELSVPGLKRHKPDDPPKYGNEDFCGYRETPNGMAYVVCDGMGGHVGGAIASELAVNSILEQLNQPIDNIYIGLNDAIQFANDQLLGKAQESPELKGMGTTVVVLIVREEGCIIGHVGDSRIYLKSDSKLYRLTKDHSFVQGLIDQGVITDDQAESHPQKNQILEALGIKTQVNATICSSPIKVKSNDCFLLCSDGLNAMINDDQILSLIDEENLEVTANNLIASANNAGGKDNITVSLIAIRESVFSVSEFIDFNPVFNVSQSTTIIEDIPEEDSNSSKKKNWLLIIGLPTVLIISVLVWFLFFYQGNVRKVDASTQENTQGVTDSLQNTNLSPIEAVKNEEKKGSNDIDDQQELKPTLFERDLLDSLNEGAENVKVNEEGASTLVEEKDSIDTTSQRGDTIQSDK